MVALSLVKETNQNLFLDILKIPQILKILKILKIHNVVILIILMTVIQMKIVFGQNGNASNGLDQINIVLLK
jgi:hypothetical protein